MKDTDPQFKHTVTCNAPKYFAWAFWTEISNWEKVEGDTVEWIRLEGPFETGTKGMTKTPGQDPQHWSIVEVAHEDYAIIEIELPGAILHNTMRFKALSDDLTLITQSMLLTGPNASDFAEGMEMLKKSAPAGLSKLVKTIEGNLQ